MAGSDWHSWEGGIVRPFGYGHDDPVCSLVDDGLFVGNVHAADPARQDRRFDAVLSLTADPQPLTTHHHPLVDGPGNDWPTFAAAADAACRLAAEGSLLVHCSHGISRSATLAAIALAVRDRCEFSVALDAVQAARLPAVPHPSLQFLAVVYLAQSGAGDAA